MYILSFLLRQSDVSRTEIELRVIVLFFSRLQLLLIPTWILITASIFSSICIRFRLVYVLYGLSSSNQLEIMRTLINLHRKMCEDAYEQIKKVLDRMSAGTGHTVGQPDVPSSVLIAPYYV